MGKLFEHLQKMRGSQRHKYFMVSTFLRHPCECVFNHRLDKNELNYQEFRKIFARIWEQHNRCRDNCPHLHKFFKKIGFNP